MFLSRGKTEKVIKIITWKKLNQIGSEQLFISIKAMPTISLLYFKMLQIRGGGGGGGSASAARGWICLIGRFVADVARTSTPLWASIINTIDTVRVHTSSLRLKGAYYYYNSPQEVYGIGTILIRQMPNTVACCGGAVHTLIP